MDSAELNIVEIIFNESTLLISQIDGESLEIGPILIGDLPAYINSGLKEAMKAFGLAIQSSGKSSVILIFILTFIMNFSANTVLSQVRSLQMITHYMMLQLNYPPVS